MLDEDRSSQSEYKPNQLDGYKLDRKMMPLNPYQGYDHEDLLDQAVDSLESQGFHGDPGKV